MIPRTNPAGAVLFTAGLLALTACGTTVAGSGAAPGGSPGVSGAASPAASPTVDYAAQAAAAVARHDKRFPEVATRCAGRSTGAPDPGAPDALPTDPEARKYAENHAFKKQAELSPQAACRGDAHAARIKAALTPVPGTAAKLSELLTGLGYEVAAGDVYGTAPNLSFVVSIPESGPCVTGHLTPPMSVKAHGSYVEGGCHEPRGGH
ncbi:MULTISPECIES: hypothetical protein [unclassified Streptomyces]|uniref:hypothetical protein n=1 Tax=unclassified Streptomyces TaxID=2593676 RepID=UPI002251DE51|nr:hypothetical protein [Streptomyces sp. NBC_01551]MCX4526448.1 hypothetical protein [Streptomyces sp. NBC_01551]